MNVSGFFVDRPIFASVLSILVFIAGLISMFTLPISEYPNVAPPSVVVEASFPGANPRVISETVATPLEEAINGVENMLYMESLATSSGRLSLRITFAIGTDPDLAQQLVQNRVAQAEPRLPDITRQLGVTVTKSSPDLTMVVHVLSPTQEYNDLYLSNYATINVRDELAKVVGVGSVAVFGSGDYAMRIWLNPDRIAERGLAASDVTNAIRRQNLQVAAGVVGGPPYADDVLTQMPINVQGRLETPEEFGDIIIRRSENGVITRLRDVARIELEAQSYAIRSQLGNQPAVAMGIFAAPGANALQISQNVRATMDRLQETMPPGLEYTVVYDTTMFVEDSIAAVIETLVEAVLLVVLVVIVFLQNWRASIIPLLAVPVSIVGTFAVMQMLGFSINVLSLFGLILAIGIVVDDAIVVVENVERNIDDGLSSRDATIKAMKEVTGPIIATSLVVAGVFIPIAFISGLTGQFYNQFALTIVVATFISTINSLTLSPSLSAVLLRARTAKPDILMRLMDMLFGWFFRLFNKGFDVSQNGYAKGVKIFVGRKAIMMVLFGGLVYATGQAYTMVPSGFVPDQDKGYLIAVAQLPPGATLDRTEAVVREMSEIALQQEGILDTVQFPGLSINGFVNAPNSGIVFLPLTPFEERTRPDLNAFALTGKLTGLYSTIDEARVLVFPAPAVSGLGTTGGFKLQIQDRADLGFEALNENLQAVIGQAFGAPEIAFAFSNFDISYPQLFADVNRTKAEQLGVPIQNIFETMQIYLGSQYINDFNQFGRTYQVIAQADSQYRATIDDIRNLQVRNINGDMVPLGAVMNIDETFGPDISSRYNGFRSADVTGITMPGFSSGQAEASIVEILDRTLPQGISYEWTELTYQQILAGDTTLIIFPLCLLLVFLVLAAQYESLALPMAVILIVPMAVFSALLGIIYVGGDNNIFTQIALFVLAGLASKNAILIVEFARDLERQGRDTITAAVEASRLRLRPILMTSFAFIMGVLPLVVSTGAGAEMRQAIGVAVFSGMLGVTFFGLIFTPVFYVLMRKIELIFSKKKDHPDQPLEQAAE